MNVGNGGDALLEEASQRQQAELEFVAAAYMPEEAWPTSLSQIHRRLRLPLFNNRKEEDHCCFFFLVDLILVMPLYYPVKTDAVVTIQAILVENNDNNNDNSASSSEARKLILDSTPHLLQLCRRVALDQATACQEAVFPIFRRAEQWVESDWPPLLLSKQSKINDDDCIVPGNVPIVRIGRRLLYSHHIIAKSKRRSLANLASHYNLGGYVKIGWPGIIVVEGLDEHCEEFVNEILRWRWQYCILCGEEKKDVSSVQQLNEMRKLGDPFMELKEQDGISTLANVCRNAGLEDLFSTCLNIHNKRKQML